MPRPPRPPDPQTPGARPASVEPRVALWEGSLGTSDSAHLLALSGNPVSTPLPGGRPAAAYMSPVMGNLLPVETSCHTVALLSRFHPLPVLQGLPCKRNSGHGPDGAQDSDLLSAETKAVCASPSPCPHRATSDPLGTRGALRCHTICIASPATHSVPHVLAPDLLHSMASVLPESPREEALSCVCGGGGAPV